MQNILLIFLIGTLIWSCKKDCAPEATRNFEVHGYLINIQDSTPITGSLTVNFRTKNS